jgi:hypothetical protein
MSRTFGGATSQGGPGLQPRRGAFRVGGAPVWPGQLRSSSQEHGGEQREGGGDTDDGNECPVNPTLLRRAPARR